MPDVNRSSGLILAMLLMFPATAAPETLPAAGRFLVADAAMRDPNFARTVVLLLHHDEEGSMGLIVNRPSGVTLSLAVPEIDPLDPDPKLFRGGPVAPHAILSLVRTDEPPEDSHEIVPGVVLLDFDVTVQALRDGRQVRFFMGHAGWAPGQLDRELAVGGWHVVAANDRWIFDMEPDDLWQQLQFKEIAALGGPPTR